MKIVGCHHFTTPCFENIKYVNFYVKKILDIFLQGVFFTGPPPKKLKYGKSRLDEVACIKDVLDTPNLT